jgi:hypothetical protein
MRRDSWLGRIMYRTKRESESNEVHMGFFSILCYRIHRPASYRSKAELSIENSREVFSLQCNPDMLCSCPVRLEAGSDGRLRLLQPQRL